MVSLGDKPQVLSAPHNMYGPLLCLFYLGNQFFLFRSLPGFIGIKLLFVIDEIPDIFFREPEEEHFTIFIWDDVLFIKWIE